MSVKVTIDCTTGEVVTEELTPEEETEREEGRVAHRQELRDRELRDNAKDKVLGKLAQAAGVTVDEVRETLGVGRSRGPKLNRPG